MTMPLSVTSTSGANPSAMFEGASFMASPSYNKPAIDFSNPGHIAVIAGLVLLFFVAKKKFK